MEATSRPTEAGEEPIFIRRGWPSTAMGGLSGIEGSALCGPAFSQVAAKRQGRRDAFLAASFQAVQASQTVLRASSGNSRIVEEVRRRGLTVLPVCPIAAPTAQDQPEPVAAG